MVYLDLGERWAEEAAQHPENGMGWQFVTVTLKDGRVLERVRLWYCGLLELPDELGTLTVDDIATLTFPANA